MPIQSGDVKLLKSAVMADVPEGGGAPTGNTIADGVSNAIFPDISELDRAGVGGQHQNEGGQSQCRAHRSPCRGSLNRRSTVR